MEGEEAGSVQLGARESNCYDSGGSHVLHRLMPKGGCGQAWWGEGLAASDIQGQVGSSVGVLSNLSIHSRTLWFKVKVSFCNKASPYLFAMSAS